MPHRKKIVRNPIKQSERPKPPVHVGHLVWLLLKNRKLNRVLLAKETNRSLTTITRQLQKPSMQVAELYEFCHVLKHNFFEDLAVSLPAEYSKAVLETNQKHAAMEEEISRLLQENEWLKQDNKKLNERVDLLIKKL